MSYVPSKPWGAAWGRVAYAQATADQGSITTDTDLTSLTVTLTLLAGRNYKVVGHGIAGSSVSTDTVVGYIRDGASAIGRWHQAAGTIIGSEGGVWVTGSGSKTYKLTLERTGSGSATSYAAAAYPAFIEVVDYGPT
jgi:hypothetical protein